MLENLTLGNVDSFLAVVLGVGALYKAGFSSKRNDFEEVIDPLFQATTRVADDYIEMFGATLEAVKVSRKPEDLNCALVQLRKHRMKMITTRARVGETLDVIRENTKDIDTRVFLARIQGVFSAEGLSKGDRKSQSRSTAMVTRLELVVAGSVTKNEIIDTISRVLTEIEEIYTALAQSYARLRVKEGRRRGKANLSIGL